MRSREHVGKRTLIRAKSVSMYYYVLAWNPPSVDMCSRGHDRDLMYRWKPRWLDIHLCEILCCGVLLWFVNLKFCNRFAHVSPMEVAVPRPHIRYNCYSTQFVGSLDLFTWVACAGFQDVNSNCGVELLAPVFVAKYVVNILYRGRLLANNEWDVKCNMTFCGGERFVNTRVWDNLRKNYIEHVLEC